MKNTKTILSSHICYLVFYMTFFFFFIISFSYRNYYLLRQPYKTLSTLPHHYRQFVKVYIYINLFKNGIVYSDKCFIYGCYNRTLVLTF